MEFFDAVITAKGEILTMRFSEHGLASGVGLGN